MKLTKFAIALVAVLALSALVASAASANQLTSPGNNSVSLTAIDTGNFVYSVDGQNVTCTESHYATGAMAVPANAITMNAVYTGCTSFGFAGSTVNMGNCHYGFTTPEKINTDEYTSKLSIICKDTKNSASNTININSSVFGSECSISIGETGNEALAHVIIHNTTGNVPKDLTFTTTVTGIRIVKNKDNGLCPLSGTGTVNNGTFNGSLTVKDINGKDILVE
ncbi:MAG TPA: hypothetical protein VFU16_06130 [Solirubrobacterales bacterium]|nr:hypothetical protein [Solirubrobacterales bacterium]